MQEHRDEEDYPREDICPNCGDYKLYTWEDSTIVVCFTCAWQIDQRAWIAAWGSIE